MDIFTWWLPVCTFLSFYVFVKGFLQEPTDYCVEDTFSAQCPDGQFIVMLSARYGRMRLGKCVQVDLGFLGCHEDVTDILDNACSGKRGCKFQVLNKNLVKGPSPCTQGLIMYLEVSYKCTKALSNEDCTPHVQKLQEPSGYISSFTNRKRRCPSRKWEMDVLPGQQVNVSLLDFGYRKDYQKGKCHALGSIGEDGHKSNSTICRNTEKEQHVYTSNGRNMIIEITSDTSIADNPEFLLHYNVFGCSDINVPQDAWYKRDRDSAIIGCETGDLQWEIHCVNQQWQGTVGVCPAPDFTMLILVCIGVGFVILIAICVAFIIIKLRRRDPPPSTMLLDADYRKSVIEPFPPMAQDSGHYRSLVKSRDKSGYPDPQTSSSGRLSHGQAPDNRTHFSTIQSTGQKSVYASREEGAPDYFVLDKQFC